MSTTVEGARPVRAMRPAALLVIAGLFAILVVAGMIALTVGAAGIPLARLPAALGLPADLSHPMTARDQLVLWSIRIPRIAAAAMIGGLLASAGAIMQGLFRNPLADPAWSASRAGASFAAAAAIVLHRRRVPGELASACLQNAAAAAVAPLRARWSTTLAPLPLSPRRGGRTSIAIFLLAGLRHRRDRQCRHWLAGVRRRRPSAP